MALAIIADNYAKGRKKHIWFSASTSLKQAAAIDLEDIGCGYVLIYVCIIVPSSTNDDDDCWSTFSTP
jgi:hypothetical protein